MIKVHRLGSGYVRKLLVKPCVEVRGASGLYLAKKRKDLFEVAEVRSKGHDVWELRRKRPFRVKRELVKHTLFTVDF